MQKVFNKARVAVLLAVFAGLNAAAWAAPARNADSSAAFPADGFGVAMSLDRPAYWTDLMPPGVRPPEITMNLTVYNNSRQPVTFTFPSSQRYDFAIRDSSGREVWRWSDGKGFLQVIGTLTLEPGEAVSFREKHRFANGQGSPLPEGVYTVQGELTARDGQSWVKRTMEGRVSFSHSHVY